MPRFKNINENDDGYIISRMDNSKSNTESQGLEKEIFIKIRRRNIDCQTEINKLDKKEEISTDINNLSKLNKNDLEIQKTSNINDETINNNNQLNQEKKIEEPERILSIQKQENNKEEDKKNNIENINEIKNEEKKDKKIQKDKKEQKQKEEFKIQIDKKNDKYPYSLVWTSIPCITHILPWIGHMGICKSNGIIYDFSGSYLINENQFFFGKPYKYAYLEPNEKERVKWDESIDKIVSKFRKEEYNFFCNNCHSFCFEVLNEIKYNGKCNYSMIGVWWLIVKKGKYLSCGNFFKTYFVFIIIVCAIIVLIVGLKLKK